MKAEWELACPICKNKLNVNGNDAHCQQDNQTYRRQAGVWRLLRPGRAAHYAQFIHEYETVRQAEGRGSDDPAYYRALPFRDLSGKMPAMWQERARSCQTLLSSLIPHPRPGRGQRLAFLSNKLTASLPTPSPAKTT